MWHVLGSHGRLKPDQQDFTARCSTWAHFTSYGCVSTPVRSKWVFCRDEFLLSRVCMDPRGLRCFSEGQKESSTQRDRTWCLWRSGSAFSHLGGVKNLSSAINKLVMKTLQSGKTLQTMATHFYHLMRWFIRHDWNSYCIVLIVFSFFKVMGLDFMRILNSAFVGNTCIIYSLFCKKLQWKCTYSGSVVGTVSSQQVGHGF